MEKLPFPPILRELFPMLWQGGVNNGAPPWADPAGLAELRQHRLTPWLYQELRARGLKDAVAPSLLQELKHDYALSLRQTHRQEQEVLKVLQALLTAGVEPILLKGADLRLRLYRDSAVRPMTDLDLLVPKILLTEARAALNRAGYVLSPLYLGPRPGFREHFESELVFTPPPGSLLSVDLHWEVQALGGFYRLPSERLRNMAIPWKVDGMKVKILSPAHALIHLCLHSLNDLYVSHELLAIQVVDLLLVITRLPQDWPRFLKEVTRCRCQRPVFLILHELRHILPQLVPQGVLAELAHYSPSWSERFVLNRSLGYLTVFFSVLHQHCGLRDRLFYLWAKLWPQSQYLAACGHSRRSAYLRQFFGKLFKKN